MSKRIIKILKYNIWENNQNSKAYFSRNKQKTSNDQNNQQKSSGFDMSNLGFFGGVTSGVRCDADDDSFFCQLTKFTSMITQLLFLLGILVIIYIVGKNIILPMLFGKSKQRGGGKIK